MRISNRGRALVLAAVCVLAISGCGGGGDDPEPEVAPDQPRTAQPSQVDGDPEPDDGGADTPAVSLPSLPVGGSANASEDGSSQCVEVRWSVLQDAAQVPEGVEIRIRGFSFDPAIFMAGGDFCGGQAPSCGGYTFTFDATTGCFVAITTRGPVAEPFDAPSMSVSGSIVCVRISATRCRDFLSAVQTEDQSGIGLGAVSATEDGSVDDGSDPDETEEPEVEPTDQATDPATEDPATDPATEDPAVEPEEPSTS